MKMKTLVAVIALACGAGCSTLPGPGSAWDVKPVVSIHHGMLGARAYYQLGRFQQKQGRLAEAEASYLQALEADEHYVDALNALGALYAQRGELERSVAILKRVVSDAPDTAYLHNNIGYALHLQGRDAEAIEAFKRAVRLDPGYARAWANLASVARSAGQPALARLAAQRRLPDAPAPVAAAASPVVVEPVETGRALALSMRLSSPAADSPSAPVQLAARVPEVQALVVKPTAKPVVAPVREPVLTVAELPVRELVAPVNAAVAEPEALAPRVMTVSLHPGATSVPAQPTALAELSTAFAGVHLEISNGNGVGRFATRVGQRFSSAGIPVARVTNYDRFDVAETIIEYHAGFESAARALRDRLGGRAQLIEAHEARRGSDVRLILGRDAVSAPPLRT